jgi:hypothetical protein
VAKAQIVETPTGVLVTGHGYAGERIDMSVEFSSLDGNRHYVESYHPRVGHTFDAVPTHVDRPRRVRLADVDGAIHDAVLTVTETVDLCRTCGNEVHPDRPGEIDYDVPIVGEGEVIVVVEGKSHRLTVKRVD